MSYESDIGNMPVIDAGNAHNFIDPIVDGEKRFCSRMPRDVLKYPYGGAGFATAKKFDTFSHDEAVKRIRQREERKSGLAPILVERGVKVKDQDGINYCWIYASTHTVEIAQALQSGVYAPLSATAAGTMITGGQNIGGYGAEAFAWLTKHGAPLQSSWREFDLNPKLWTPEIEHEASQHLVKDFYELPVGDVDQLLAAVLHNFPVAIGLPWWHHEVTIIDAVLLAGDRIGFVFDNSWGNWGDNGRGVLTADKASGDMFCPVITSLTGTAV